MIYVFLKTRMKQEVLAIDDSVLEPCEALRKNSRKWLFCGVF